MYNWVKGSVLLAACLWTVTALALPNATSDVARLSSARLHEYAASGGELESLLLREEDAANGLRWTGVTRLRDGTRLWEEARFDSTGELTRVEMMCACASGQSETVRLEPKAGSVEVRSARGMQRWQAPTDYPWIWVPRGCAHQASLATPLAALLAMRAAPHGLRRLIDTSEPASHTIANDQVFVAEDASATWVVVGDDAVLVRDGIPQRWHANALGLEVQRR